MSSSSAKNPSSRRDRYLLTAAKALRSVGYGLLSVVLGLHLPAIGLGPSQVGLVFTATLLGSALLTAVSAALADRLGRRRTLIFSALMMILAGILFAFTRRFEGLILVSLLGTISPTSGEVGPFETLEQAILPQLVTPGQRNRAFGWYNSLAALMTSLGAFLSSAPLWLGRSVGGNYEWAFAGYAGLGIATLLCFLSLSPVVELAGSSQRTALSGNRLNPQSRRIIFGLAGLFGLDSLGGGFVVQSLIVYWFNLEFGIGVGVLGPLFSAIELIKALSYLIAVRLADRIGLVNTMVFTHLPSNLFLIGIPLMPAFPLAIALLLLRHTLSQMDVPTRQSYVVAVVPPEDRTVATGITNVTRTVTRIISPSIAGLALQITGAGLPFFIGGTLKIVYDLALFVRFKNIRPAEDDSND